MSTTAKDCSDEPKIIASERDASTSSPIATAPVMATTAQAQRRVGDEATPFAVVTTGSAGLAIPINRVRLNHPAVAPMMTFTIAVIWSDETSPRFCTSQKPASPAPTTAPRLFTE